MVERIYECKKCGKKVKTTEDRTIECCGVSMKQIPLDQCVKPHDAEYAGPFEEDKPCNNGRAGMK